MLCAIERETDKVRFYYPDVAIYITIEKQAENKETLEVEQKVIRENTLHLEFKDLVPNVNSSCVT